jgi:hypothetical protein
MCGDGCGEPGTYSFVSCGPIKSKRWLTGVRSRLSSSVAEAAASIRSSHRLPNSAAAVCGSAEYAFRSWLIRRLFSFDLVRSCFGLRAFWPTEDLRGRFGFMDRGAGGRVEERPGGDLAIDEGSNSRCSKAEV